ncbi:BglG family transcription antiterminator [Bacillus sp. NPDC077027]|uniref:BglG family transcription antiterminator n=1 Tax=Bacillus sp. NPDC077027 TaxID=3390548 RepID=UPI003CFDA8FF
MFLTKRGTNLLMMLLYTPSRLSMEDMQNALNVSTRTIYYEINRINDWLKSNKHSLIQREHRSGYYVKPDEKEAIKKNAETLHVGESYELCMEERRALLILSIACHSKPLFVEDLSSFAKVSRNTILDDIKQLKQALSSQQIMLHFNVTSGYFLSGAEMSIRHALRSYIHRIRPILVNKEKISLSTWIDGPISRKRMRALLIQCELELEIEFADDMLEQLSLDLFFYLKRIKLGKDADMSAEEKSTLQETREFFAAIRFMTRVQEESGLRVKDDEVYFLSTLFLSAKKQKLTQPKSDQEHHLIRSIARKMIFDFQRYACISFQEQSELERNLMMHLKPAYYRMKYKIKVINELTDSVRNAQPEVFGMTKKVAIHLEQATCGIASDHEIAYLAMHFGGWMRREGISTMKRQSVIIVCAEGIGTSHMLKTQLLDLIAYIEIRGMISKREYECLQTIDADFIVSTTPISSKGKPVHIVHPILTPYEKKTLLRYGEGGDFSSDEHMLEDILTAIHKHTIVQNEQALLQDIKELLQPSFASRQKGWKPVLNDLLKRETIQLKQTAQTWQDAITKAAQPLLSNHSIEETYIDAMIQSVHQNGPYIVIAPEVAIPHARPEDGVNTLGMSLMSLKEPVYFSEKEEKPVRLIIVLAAIDSVTHLKALQQLTTLLSDQKHIEQLSTTNRLTDVQSLIQHFSTI